MAASLRILTFHALDDLPSVISVPPSLFRRAMARLRERGFQTLDLIEAVEPPRRGVHFPLASLVITSDDGYHLFMRKGSLSSGATERDSTFSLPLQLGRAPSPSKGLSYLHGCQRHPCLGPHPAQGYAA